MPAAFIRLFGSRTAHKEQFLVAVAMLAVTGLYEYLSIQFAPGYALNIYEFIGTWSGLVCVWLSRTRNILCWPWGIVSSIALGMFFSQIGLPGQQWLNWIYFIPIQILAWPYWAFGGEKREELPVTSLTLLGWVLTLASVVLGTLLVYQLIGFFSPGSFHPVLDATVVAASITAQYLLGKKKVESWILWLGPVNLLSIILFYSAGAYTVAALYVAFFVHAVFALSSWKNARLETARATSASHG